MRASVLIWTGDAALSHTSPAVANRAAIAERGAIERLVALLAMPSAAVQEQALGALVVLADDCACLASAYLIRPVLQCGV